MFQIVSSAIQLQSFLTFIKSAESVHTMDELCALVLIPDKLQFVETVEYYFLFQFDTLNISSTIAYNFRYIYITTLHC